MSYELVKWIHILSFIVLLGTGLGSAFYKFMADRSKNVAHIAHTNRHVVLADWFFTTPTVIVQPLTGVWLAQEQNYPLASGWLMGAIVLFIIAGLCWLRVVWLQIRMRNIAEAALRGQHHLPAHYWRDVLEWFWLGVPAFISMVIIAWLMVDKPTFFNQSTGL